MAQKRPRCFAGKASHRSHMIARRGPVATCAAVMSLVFLPFKVAHLLAVKGVSRGINSVMSPKPRSHNCVGVAVSCRLWVARGQRSALALRHIILLAEASHRTRVLMRLRLCWARLPQQFERCLGEHAARGSHRIACRGLVTTRVALMRRAFFALQGGSPFRGARRLERKSMH